MRAKPNSPLLAFPSKQETEKPNPPWCEGGIKESYLTQTMGIGMGLSPNHRVSL